MSITSTIHTAPDDGIYVGPNRVLVGDRVGTYADDSEALSRS